MSRPILISLMGFYLTYVLYRDDTRLYGTCVVTNYMSVEREWSNVYFSVRSKSSELMKKNDGELENNTERL